MVNNTISNNTMISNEKYEKYELEFNKNPNKQLIDTTLQEINSIFNRQVTLSNITKRVEMSIWQDDTGKIIAAKGPIQSLIRDASGKLVPLDKTVKVKMEEKYGKASIILKRTPANKRTNQAEVYSAEINEKKEDKTARLINKLTQCMMTCYNDDLDEASAHIILEKMKKHIKSPQ